MARRWRPFAMLCVALIGLGLFPVSPVLSTVVNGLAAVGVFVVGMGFNVPATRWARRGVAVTNGVAAFLWSQSVLVAAAPVLIVSASDFGNETIFRGIGRIRHTYVKMVLIVVAFVLASDARALGWSAFALAPVMLLGALNLLFSFMSLPEITKNRDGPRAGKIKLGEVAPEFVLPRRSGEGEFRLADEKGRYVLLCFLRGDWCPVCQVLMRAYRKAAVTLAENGVKLVVINPSSGEEARAFAKDMGLEYEILVDHDLALAQKMGLVSESKGPNGQYYPLPVSFLVDPKGVVRFISGLDDLTFLTPERIAALLKPPAVTAGAATSA